MVMHYVGSGKLNFSDVSVTSEGKTSPPPTTQEAHPDRIQNSKQNVETLYSGEHFVGVQ